MLESPNLTEQLKTMSIKEKESLAEEIRSRLIQVVPQNGGHLASNLGVVEITLALYSLLDPFVDRIIWDVGHQAYVHKILTGRNDRFESIRKEGGLSGFPSRNESFADCFDTGHSSTSISAAVGFARARDLQGQSHRVVAVIGDGAFGNGMTFEALNDAGRITNDLIIILNDNGMSISSNVGGMSKYLGGIRSKRSYVRLKKNVKSTLLRIPKFGKWLVRRIQRIKASIRLLFVPGELFEELGCKYIGPIDGHDIQAMEKAIDKAIYMGGPVLIHAITKKGKGYAPAEDDPTSYHGVSPSVMTTYPSYSSNAGQVLSKMAEEDPSIVTISAAMGTGTGLHLFEKKFPDRFIDVGIAESHAVTMAGGMAAGGLRPYICLYSTFMQRAYDQFLHDCALQKLPVTVLLDRAGVSGADGKTHQGIYDYSFLKSMPDIVVAAPCCLQEQGEMIRLSGTTDRPFVIRYPAKDNSGSLPDSILRNPVELGKGVRVLGEKNPAVLIVSFGQMTVQAIAAAAILREQGISCEVFHSRFMFPFDYDGLKDLLYSSNLDLIVTLEDGVISGGCGELFLEKMHQNDSVPAVPVKLMGYPSEPVSHGTIEQIYKRYGLDGVGIAAKIRAIVQRWQSNET